jgi:hypothetical protein
MSLDLTDLTPLCDVSILVSRQHTKITIRFTKFSDIDQYLDIQQMIGQGLEVYKILNELIIFPGNYDKFQIAERIAAYLESQGLRIRRLINDPKLIDQSPHTEIQSFILA